MDGWMDGWMDVLVDGSMHELVDVKDRKWTIRMIVENELMY